MADNLTTTTTVSTIPSGTKISTDEDLTNGHVQRVKLAYSADGSSTHVQADADGMLVNLGANNDVTVTGTVDLGATDNAVLDAIAASVAGTLTVDGSGTTQPVSDAGGSLTVDNAALSVTGGGVEASALRVTIASDSTGVVSVDDGGGSLTVDGTVTANLSATDNAVLDAIAASVAGTLTVGSHAVTNAGTFATQATLQANSGVDIGDVDVTSVVPGTGATNLGKAIDTAAGATDTGIAALAIRDDSLTTLTPVDGDYVPLRVNSSGALHVTGAGGGTQYNVDDAGPTVVTMAGVVRDDTLTTLTEVDGDATVLRVSSTGALHVTGGGGGTEYTDDTSTHATGSSVGNLMMAAATPTDGSVDANDIGAVAMSVDRRLHVDAQIVGQDADVTIADGGNSITVDNGGTFAVQVDAALPAGNNNIGNVDIASSVALDVSAATVPISDAGGSLTVDNAALTTADLDTGAGTDTRGVIGIALAESGGATVVGSANPLPISDAGGSITVDGTITADAGTGPWPVTDNGGSLTVDNAALSVTGGGVESGALRVTIANDSTGVVSVDDNGGSLTVDGTVTASNAAGDVAHDSADSGNPVKVGFKAYNMDGTAPGTAVAENDRANGISDVYGRQFVETAHPNLWQAMGLYSTAQTDVSVKAAPGAGLSLYITDIVVSTDTAMSVFFEQSTTKVYGTLYLAANGGASSHFRTPIKLPANTALTFTSSATGNHSVTVNGYTAA